jgi:hypothetical protein
MIFHEVAAGFKTALEQIDGVQVYDYVPDSSNWPCVIIYPEGAQVDTPSTATFVLWALTGRADERGAQETLSRWLSPDDGGEFIEALDDDNTLGGACMSVIPREVRNWGLGNPNEGRPSGWQAELVCEVL